jgi:hypothetical protein
MNDMESRKFEDAFKRAFDEASVSPSDNVWTNIERTMDDMESRKFGGAFQQAFDEAGVRPSENVWINIELDLMRAEGGKMKRRLVFFQLLAAASIVFALSIAGVGYYILKDQQLTGAGGQLAYREEVTAGTNASTNTTTSAVDAQGRSRSADTQTEQESTEIASVSGGQHVDAAEQEQNSSTTAGAASPVTVADTNSDGTSYVAGAAQPRRATVEGAGITTPQQQVPAAQPNSTETQQASVYPDKQRRRATDGGATSGVTTSSGAAKDSRSTKGRNGNTVTTGTSETGMPQLAGTQQPAGVTTPDRMKEATDDTRKKSSGRIVQDNARLAQADETDATRYATIGEPGGQHKANAQNKGTVTADATTTPGVAIPNVGQQTEYMLAYSPVPSKATPVVTSLGTRVQKPASMKVEPASTVDPLVALLARLDEQEKNANTKDKKDQRDEEEFAPEKLWTSVGFSAGSFNTINSSVSNSSGGSMMMADARKDAVDKVANQQAKASGSSYSVGVSLGTRISSRWVLQGGVNYMTQASDYTASAVGTADYENFQAPSVNSIMSADKLSMSAEALSNVVPTAPYNVNNSLQFVSVPVQAGYLLVNRKVGVQLNGGLSTDLFIQNTITPEGENLEKETKSNGSDSPYRTVNFSGLVGTELTYRFSKHYRLALNPGLRYPLNSIYKSDQPVTAAPLTFDIGLRFRYIFH